jgi:hypothetical protein
MKLFALGAVVVSVGMIVYGVWVSSVGLVASGALVLVIGVLSATVYDLTGDRQ